VIQTVEHLDSKCEALSSNPTTAPPRPAKTRLLNSSSNSREIVRQTLNLGEDTKGTDQKRRSNDFSKLLLSLHHFF
jgi:hypothetical protein